MAELTIRPDEIRDAIERNVAAFTPETSREEVGRVVETGDGIARVEGLHNIIKDVASDIGMTRTRHPGWKTTDM